MNLKELEVYLKRPRFQLSLNGKSFDVNISWDEPTFNRKLSGYQVSHKVGNSEKVVNATVSILTTNLTLKAKAKFKVTSARF